jgi:hypothetical protein
MTTILLDNAAGHEIRVNTYSLTTGSGISGTLNGTHTRGVDNPAGRTASGQSAPIEARGVFASPLQSGRLSAAERSALNQALAKALAF